MQKRNKRILWLVAAFVLLGVAAWLMSTGDEERVEQAAKVDFPRSLREPERKRMVKRRTMPTLPVAPAAENAPEPVVVRDPVLAALPRGKGRTAVVIEANAIRNSPLGEMLLECLQQDGDDKLSEFREKTGIDPLQDLDRVAMWEGHLVLSGNFGKAQWQELFKDGAAERYGDRTEIFTPRLPEGAEREVPSFGSFDNQMIVMGKSPSEVKDVIDRLEGRTSSTEQPLISETQTYGEIYGVVSAEDLARMLPPEQAMLADKLRAAAQNIELHVDTQQDVAITADVTGPNGADVKDLGKALGGALSLARLKAKADGDTEAEALLDYARVNPSDGSFKLEMAMPLEALKKQLAFCKERRPGHEEPATQATETR